MSDETEREQPRRKHIRLASHPGGSGAEPIPIHWGAKDPAERGPLIASFADPKHRNVIGTHSGSYAVYRALAVAAGQLAPDHRADLTNTNPTHTIQPNDSWYDGEKIVSMDPWGHEVASIFGDWYERGYDIRPTVAITQAHLEIPELKEAIAAGRLEPDGKVLKSNGSCLVTKAAIEPVWYLPGLADRFRVSEADLRRTLFEQTGGMFPDLVTRGDLEVFLPPIGGQTVYVFGPVSQIGDTDFALTCRVHDECNGSDVFGSDICTCRPYLTHGIEECIRSVQAGGSGLIVYNRKEGRALGEVTKFLVYNARKRQEGGDTPAAYFTRTECVAGVQDVRFQELMPDVLHWLGVRRIDRFVSMSNMKHDALTGSGIEIGERIEIPEELVPEDAKVEIDAKMAAGYFTIGAVPTDDELAREKGRQLEDA